MNFKAAVAKSKRNSQDDTAKNSRRPSVFTGASRKSFNAIAKQVNAKVEDSKVIGTIERKFFGAKQFFTF